MNPTNCFNECCNDLFYSYDKWLLRSVNREVILNKRIYLHVSLSLMVERASQILQKLFDFR